MILIGNGPLPFAHPGTGTQPTGAASRETATQQGTGTIPAASTERTGQAPGEASAAISRTALRPVLASSRLDSTETDPEALYRQSGQSRVLGKSDSEQLDRRSAPVPPLKSYANVPTEITAEIQRLRQENAELKAELEARGAKGPAEPGPEATKELSGVEEEVLPSPAQTDASQATNEAEEAIQREAPPEADRSVPDKD